MSLAYFDVDTQFDFILPAGALYVPGAERLIPLWARLNQEAFARGIPVISTLDTHLEDDVEFQLWPPHCVAGTAAHAKPASLAHPGASPLHLAEQGGLPVAPQILVQKSTLNCFQNPHLVPWLDMMGIDRCLVYGVVTEYCVRHAALGLLQAGRQVEVLAPAIQGLQSSAAAAALNEIRAAGGAIVEQSTLSATLASPS